MSIRDSLKKMAPGFLTDGYIKLREKIIRAEFRLFGIFTIDPDKVAFCNVWGYGDNPKWIAQAYVRLLENSGSVRDEKRLGKTYFITGKIPENAAELGDGAEKIRFVKNNSVRAVFTLATSRIWVDCNRKESYIKKRRGQCYIQTWHGSLPLKKIERDCKSSLSGEYLKNAARDTAMTDIFISNSEFFNDICRRAFGFNGKIFCFGTPRMDPLLAPDAERIEKTKRLVVSKLPEHTVRELGIGDGKIPDGIKLCLYAPTYREDDSTAVRKAKRDSLSIKDALEWKFGGTFIIVTRMHPLAMSRVSQKDNVYLSFDDDWDYTVDGNGFGDIYGLMEAADVLITDYSNTLFEFAEARKPVFLYAPDADEYIGSRGMYFDYKELPYPVSGTKKELRDSIIHYDTEKIQKKQKDFFDRFSLIENGRASEKLAKLVRGLSEGPSKINRRKNGW